MTTDITELAQSLKAAAEKASGGDWVKESGDGWDATCSNDDQANSGFIIAHFVGPDSEANREFVQLANPANIRALVEVLEKAQATEAHCNRGWREAHEQEARAEAVEKRIAELESRSVKLPEVYGYLRENDGQIQISIGAKRPSDRSGGYATPWFAIYTAAGIKWEAE